MHINLRNKLFRISASIATILVLVAFSAINAHAQGSSDPRARAMQEEIRYIRGLQQWGLMDYADIVINRLKTKYPEAANEIKVMELRGLLSIGEFDKVKSIIKRAPNQKGEGVWAMKTALADGYYAWGKYAEAQEIYDGFFAKYKSGPPASLNKFYIEAAYKYAQMLLLMGNESQAINAYDLVLKAKLDRHIERQVLSEMAEVMLKVAESSPARRPQLFARVKKITDKILWVQDLWFGKAIVYLAHMNMMQGDLKAANALIEDYQPQLKGIHDTLVEQSTPDEDLTRLSPIAQCRYLLGVMLHDEAKKLLKSGGSRDRIVELLAGKEIAGKTKSGKPKRSAGALHHFLNVFIRFPSTQWAPQAGVRAREIEETLKKEFGAKIQTKVTEEQMDEVRRYQFQHARSEFNQQQFQNAVESYVDVLTLFPEGETSVAAISELCQSYVELGEELFADMTASYLAERFAGNKELMVKGGDQVLKLAMYCGDRNMMDKRDKFHDLYFENYKDHPRVAGMLFMFGDERFNQEDYEGALKYFSQITEEYPDSPAVLNAASKTAYSYSKMENYTNEVKSLKAFIAMLEKEENPGHMLISARFRLAYAYKQLGQKFLPSAYNRYSELIKMLQDKTKTYYRSKDEQEANLKILEGALFYRALCISSLKTPEDKIPTYRTKAVESLNALVKEFPKSQFAPSSLSQIGTLHMLLEQPEEAEEALGRLQKEYPKSEEAKNSLFLLGKSLLELGYRRKGIEVFKKMFEGKGQYSSAQLLTTGKELIKAEEYELALQAFQRVLKMEKNRIAVEPAMLGRGQALLAMNKAADAVKVLSDMLGKYPNSGYTVPACLALSQGYAELGMIETDNDQRYLYFNDAVKAMNRAKKFEKDPAGREKLNIGVARIYTRKAKAEEKFGTPEAVREAKGFAVATYQIIIALADPRNPAVREHIGTSYVECIPLMIEIEKYAEAKQDAQKYIELYPRGKHLSDVRKMLTRANIKMSTSGTPEAEEAEKPAPPAEESVPPDTARPADAGEGEPKAEPETKDNTAKEPAAAAGTSS